MDPEQQQIINDQVTTEEQLIAEARVISEKMKVGTLILVGNKLSKELSDEIAKQIYNKFGGTARLVTLQSEVENYLTVGFSDAVLNTGKKLIDMSDKEIVQETANLRATIDQYPSIVDKEADSSGPNKDDRMEDLVTELISRKLVVESPAKEDAEGDKQSDDNLSGIEQTDQFGEGYLKSLNEWNLAIGDIGKVQERTSQVIGAMRTDPTPENRELLEQAVIDFKKVREDYDQKKNKLITEAEKIRQKMGEEKYLALMKDIKGTEPNINSIDYYDEALLNDTVEKLLAEREGEEERTIRLKEIGLHKEVLKLNERFYSEAGDLEYKHLVDFKTEAEKLPKEFTRNLPARGLRTGRVRGDFVALIDSLDKGVSSRAYWGSFYVPKLESSMQMGGLGYSAYNQAFMLIGRPGEKLSDSGGVSAVLVPRQYERLIPKLKEAYPDVRFITDDEIKDLPEIVKR
jgi:hypothetical protein